MVDDQNTRLIELDSFDTAAAVEPGEEAQTKRRFMTLLVDASVSGDPARARVRKAYNTEGETFAVKSLFPLVGPAAGVPEGMPDETLRALASAFFEEYRNLFAVSNLKGFPKVYGYGFSGRAPVMVMEWIEGPNLLEAHPLLPHATPLGPEPAGVEANAVAAIGEAAASALAQTTCLDSTFVHRDISPRNILFDASSRSVAEQVADGSYDVRIVDLESSCIVRQAPTTFTMRSNIWRHGTPEYAAPEMLTNDIEGVERLRLSPSVDVYALCSVLYELYAGRTPYDVASRPLESPYRIKMAGAPAGLPARSKKDEGLVEAILAGTHLSMTGSAGAGASRRVDTTPAAELPEEGAAAEASAGAKKGKALLSHRAAVLLGIGALGVAAAAVATRGFGLLRPRTLDGYSWEELAALAGRIAAAGSDEEGIVIAREAGLVNADGKLTDEQAKRFSLADGSAAEARVVGFRADERADGQGVAGISFLMRTPVGDARPMNDTAQTGGWEQSSLREWMANEMPALLPAELAARVREVVKVSNNVGAVGAGDEAELTRTADAFWLPSMSELCGYQGPETFAEGYEYLSHLYSDEGTQYQLFRELGVSGLTENDALVREVDGKSVFWWERTPSADGSVGEPSTLFNRVMRNGDAFCGAVPGEAPDEPTYVIPGFCL